MAPLANSSLRGPRAARRPPRESCIVALRRPTRRSKQGTPISPPARRLPLVGEWVARGFVVEGVGWPQPAFPESGALGRRGALLESRTVSLDAQRDDGSFEARRSRHRPVGCFPWASSRLGAASPRQMSWPSRQNQPQEPSAAAASSLGSKVEPQRRQFSQGIVARGDLATGAPAASRGLVAG